MSTVSPEDALRRAIDVVGGQSALAGALGRRQSTIWSWLNEQRQAAAEVVLRIEELTREAGNEVSRHELRPDIYPLEEAHAVAPPLVEQFKPQAAE